MLPFILKNKYYGTLLLSLLFINSCIPFKKTIILKESKEQKEKEVINLTHDYDDYQIQIDDFIRVQVISPDKESVEIFNTSTGNNNQVNLVNDLRSSYRVEENGNIRLPLIGDTPVNGLTLTELRDSLQNIFSEYYKFVTIKVELVSFNVTFLGEVSRPGQVRVFTENTNFFQVLSNAGSQTEFANNKRVKLLRRVENTVEVHYIDISTLDFISSEFYYLKPYDIVYIEPLKAKSQRDNLFLFGTLTSLIGLSISILALLRR